MNGRKLRIAGETENRKRSPAHVCRRSTLWGHYPRLRSSAMPYRSAVVPLCKVWHQLKVCVGFGAGIFSRFCSVDIVTANNAVRFSHNKSTRSGDESIPHKAMDVIALPMSKKVVVKRQLFPTFLPGSDRVVGAKKGPICRASRLDSRRSLGWQQLTKRRPVR